MIDKEEMNNVEQNMRQDKEREYRDDGSGNEELELEIWIFEMEIIFGQDSFKKMYF